MSLFHPPFYLRLLMIAMGFVDSGGNRITMQGWWQHRSAPMPSTARSAQVDEIATSENERPPSAVRNENSRPPQVADSANNEATESPGASAIQADALIVNDETIRVGDILEPLTPKLEELVRELPPESYYQKAMQLVRLQIIEAVAQHLIWRRAQRHLTDEMKPQLDKAVDKMEKDRINREFGGRETVYEKYLARHGKTRADVRERLKRSLVIDSYLRDRLLQLIPAPRKSELEDYYRTHVSQYSQPERRELFLIDIPIRAFLDPSRPITPADEAAAEQAARHTVEEAATALKGGEEFQAVARKFSQGLHTDEGGAWGFITAPTDRMSAPLQGRWAAPSTRLFKLKPGETSEIIESARSFFIVKCGQSEGGQSLSFQEAQPKIVGEIRQQKFLERRAAPSPEDQQSPLEPADHDTLGSP
jgi:parvulin-like peptidyl-prolyl cis-trans isomerase-like protein